MIKLYQTDYATLVIRWLVVGLGLLGWILFGIVLWLLLLLLEEG